MCPPEPVPLWHCKLNRSKVNLGKCFGEGKSGTGSKVYRMDPLQVTHTRHTGNFIPLPTSLESLQVGANYISGVLRMDPPLQKKCPQCSLWKRQLQLQTCTYGIAKEQASDTTLTEETSLGQATPQPGK